MNEFDPAVRLRILWRYAALVLGIIAVGLLIGIAVGRPFAGTDRLNADVAGTPIRATAQATSAPSTPSPDLAQTTTPSAPTASGPLPTLAPDAGWKILTEETFDSATTWPASQQTGWAAGYEAGRYWLKLDGQRTISYSIPIDSSECWVAADVQVQSGYAGLIILASDPNIVYRLLIDNAGRYRLERQQAGSATALRDWTASAALETGPQAHNRIEVRRVENEITLIANDTELMRYTLPDGQTYQSRVGMTIDAIARDSGAFAYFDNLVVRIPVVPPIID
jgi:hypothetical protein